MLERSRPLSPYPYYRWQYTNTSSILHRATGIILSAGYLLLTCWLMAIARGPVEYARAELILSYPPCKALLALGLSAFAYHFCNGIRCLFWDAGYGLERREARRSAWIVVIDRCACGYRVGLQQRGHLMSAARRGADSRWAQRVTALVLVPLGAWFCLSLLSLPTLTYPVARAWVPHSWNAALLIALILAAAQHSYLGLRAIVEDYIADVGMRIAMLQMVRFVHILSAAGAVLAVFAVTFGLLA